MVEITNAENENGMGFYHLNFYPYQKVDVRPSGYYTFSFYLKADREAEFRVAKTTNLDTIKTFTSTTEWVRYDATSYWDGAKVYVAPGLWFPRKGTFYIAAPQLEQGDQVSPYHSAPVDMVPNTSYIDDVEADIAGRTLPEGAQYSIYDAANASLFYQNEVKAQFEYDYYTEEDSDIVLSVDSNTAQSVNIVITSEYGNVFTQSAELLKGQNIIQMPITVFAGQGNYYCSLVNNITNTELATAKFKRIPANDNGYEVRLNRLTGAPEIKTQDGTTKPFYIQGISEYGTPDNEWYYQDLVDHGINTIVIFENMGAKSAPDSVEAYKEELDKALTHAHNVGLKVILGYAWAGLKSGTAYNVNRFYQLVDLYKDNTDVIAWYVLDEFRSDAEYSGEFSNGDLIDIYNHIKGVDPYRPVLLNWSGNMGDVVGQEPHTFYRDDDSPSVFEATDIYSRTGSYPFTRRTYYKGSKLSEYVKVNITAQRTAKAFNKGAHGWIQMWGFYDAWREPSVPEYRYMAYLNVIYGSMYSYFGKPFSTHSWDNISEIQKETKEIAEIIFDKDSQILFEPRIDSDQKNFIYTAVKDKNEDIYLIVMRNNHPITNSFDQEQFVFNPFTISDNGFTTQPHITSKYESNRLVPTNAAGLVQEYFSSWETRVYVIHNDSY